MDSGFRFLNGLSMDNLVVGAVPEPGMAWLLLLATPFIGLRRRRGCHRH